MSFLPLNVESKERMLSVLAAADKAGGYCYSGSGQSMRSLASAAAGGATFEYARTGEVSERFVLRDEAEDEARARVGEVRERLWNDLDKMERMDPDFQV